MGLSVIILLTCFVSIFAVASKEIEWDEKGYVVYCPCMGRFGNQADYLLGALGFAKRIDRTLILPPWLEFGPSPRATVVPFDKYVDVKGLEKFHRVITMEEFFRRFADDVWPADKRISVCYRKVESGKGPDECDSKRGNPPEPFWNNFNVDFVGSRFYEGLTPSSDGHASAWQQRFPVSEFPVLSFVNTPFSFPVSRNDVHIGRYVRLSKNVMRKAEKAMEKMGIHESPFVGIHLRMGSDWEGTCSLLNGRYLTLMSSAQCTGYMGERGALTKDICMPPFDTIISQLRDTMDMLDVDTVFVASDVRTAADQLSRKLGSKATVVSLKNDDPHADLAILSRSKHFIGNCVSSYTAFVKRRRDADKLESSFWAFNRPSKAAKHAEL